MIQDCLIHTHSAKEPSLFKFVDLWQSNSAFTDEIHLADDVDLYVAIESSIYRRRLETEREIAGVSSRLGTGVGGWSKLRLNIKPHFTYCFKIMPKISASGIVLVYSTWNRRFIVWRAICPLLIKYKLGRPCSSVGNIQVRMNQINLDWIKVGSRDVGTRKNTSIIVTMCVNVFDLFLVNEVENVIIYYKKTRN